MSYPRFDFSGSTVLVTGGTSGLGHGIATAFRDAGAEVTITGTRADASAYDEDLRGMRYLHMNAADDAGIDALPASFERLDVLVNNAGGVFVRENEYEPATFDKALRVNLAAVYRLTHACHQLLARSTQEGGASVLGIASMTSYFGMEYLPAYGTTKTALLGLTRALAVAWGRERIRVNAIAAGLALSRMTAHMMANAEAIAPTLARTPLGRLGTPADIAGAALFLSSPAASWITGQTLAVDGGFTIAG
jgi:3-oxoacyl-[acyl-carrier protein] reductase